MLRHEATKLPGARDGSVAIRAALTLLPKQFQEFPMLVGAMRPEGENENPSLLMLRDWHQEDIFRIVEFQGHNLSFQHPRRLELDACPTSCCTPPATLLHFSARALAHD